MLARAAGQLDPESLVARIIAELQANPAAQQLLLRAMLTNEFLGMPARLDAIQKDVADLKADVADLKRRAAVLESDVATLKSDVAALKGDSLEIKLHRRIRPYLSQKLGLRRARTLHSAVADTDRDLCEALYDAVDADRITEKQETRVFATDLILRAERRDDRATVWVAVEASNAIDARDVERARESADALQAIFGDPALGAVMGYAIPDDHRRLAGARGVEVFVVEENH